MMQDRRAAPVSKVFTIPAKNKVQRPGQERLLLSRRNWQQKAESPSAHSSPAMGVRHSLSPGEEGPLGEGGFYLFPRGERRGWESKRRSRGRFLVLLVAIYSYARNAGPRYTSRNHPTGHLLRLQGYTGSFFAREDPLATTASFAASLSAAR